MLGTTPKFSNKPKLNCASHGGVIEALQHPHEALWRILGVGIT
jgi:hypothetical protein